MIKITNLHNGDKVNEVVRVCGIADPDFVDLNILVYSNDGLWYFQQAVDSDGQGSWSVETHFGDSESIPRSHYEVIVINKHLEVKTPIRELPKGVKKSKIVRVKRRN